jgi:hypothetical protein
MEFSNSVNFVNNDYSGITGCVLCNCFIKTCSVDCFLNSECMLMKLTSTKIYLREKTEGVEDKSNEMCF